MKQKNNNRYKQIFMADKGYDSKDILKILKKKGYKPIIPQNLRNIKNPKLIRKMYSKDKKVYKKRIIVENFFAWIKKNPKIDNLYEKTIASYKGLLFLACSKIIFKRCS